MAKVLRDASGIYNLAAIASIHPVNLKGDKLDQSKVTGQHTLIHMMGGASHNTTIPFAAADSILTDYWGGSAPAKSDAPNVAPAPAPTTEEKLNDAQRQYGG